VPKAVGIWRQLARKHAVDFFVALSMPSKNKGSELPPAVMKYLGDRGIAAGFDIYYDGEEGAERTTSPNRRRARLTAVRTPQKGGGR